MIRGLLLKSLRQTWVATCLFAAALGVVEAVLAFALPTVFEQLGGEITQMPLVRSILGALLGTDVGMMLSPEAVHAISWVHPVVLVILWGHAVVLCTRVPAGEIDRGTIDLLLSLPVSRFEVYAAEVAVILASGAVVTGAGVLGNGLGRLGTELQYRQDPARLLPVVVNLFALYMAVAGLAWLVSSFSERRGRAVAVVVAVLVASFLLNFLGQFWPPAQAVAFLSLLDHYKPLAVMHSAAVGSWPLADIAILCATALGLGTAAGLWYTRRDICTV